jgi:hypothetical protein
MHALCADSERNIHAVIDQQRHTILSGDLVQLLRGVDLVSGVALFVSVLDHRDTCAKR